jgi:hypothetical protein
MKNLSVWQLAGITFTAVFGTLLHFLYNWTGQNLCIASFSAVNESTWEHLKLFFFPAFLFALIQSLFLYKDVSGFWSIKLFGAAVGLLLIPILFYTVSGAFGSTPDWVNILFFFLAIFTAYTVEFYLFKRRAFQESSPLPPLLIFLTISCAFFLFTFFPPKIPLFECPVTGGYGIYA